MVHWWTINKEWRIMKYSKACKIYSALLISVVSVLSGCTTTEKFNLTTSRGANVYTPANTISPIVVTKGDETVKIEVPSSDYYGYMIAKDNATGMVAPFGLNVKRKIRYMEKAAVGVGYGLSAGGLTAMIPGLAFVISGGVDEDDDLSTTGGLITGCGGLAAGLGVAIGAPADSRLRQLTHTYQFTYSPHQTISFDGLSTKIINPDLPKGVTELPAPQVRPKATSGKKQENKSLSTSTGKVRSDLGKKVEGEYHGTGQLLINGKVEEDLSNVLLKIERIDKNHVNVRVIESGEDFFAEHLEYVVEHDTKGGWLLRIESIPSATISIDKTGKFRFEHKAVNIEDEVYTLLVSGRKSK